MAHLRKIVLGLAGAAAIVAIAKNMTLVGPYHGLIFT